MPAEREKRAALAELARVASELGPALAPVGYDDLLQGLTDLGRSIFDAAACSIAVLDEDEETLTFRAASGEGADRIVGTSIDMGEGIAGWVMASEQPATVEEPARDPRFAADVAASTGYMPRVIHAMPLQTDRAMLGVLEILDPGPQSATGPRETEILSLFARQAALAIEGAAVFSHLGRGLLESLAAAADDESRADLVEAARLAPRPSGELEDLTRLFHDLAQMGPEELRVAMSILSGFIDYAQARGAGS